MVRTPNGIGRACGSRSTRGLVTMVVTAPRVQLRATGREHVLHPVAFPVDQRERPAARPAVDGDRDRVAAPRLPAAMRDDAEAGQHGREPARDVVRVLLVELRDAA